MEPRDTMGDAKCINRGVLQRFFQILFFSTLQVYQDTNTEASSPKSSQLYLSCLLPLPVSLQLKDSSATDNITHFTQPTSY